MFFTTGKISPKSQMCTFHQWRNWTKRNIKLNVLTIITFDRSDRLDFNQIKFLHNSVPDLDSHWITICLLFCIALRIACQKVLTFYWDGLYLEVQVSACCHIFWIVRYICEEGKGTECTMCQGMVNSLTLISAPPSRNAVSAFQISYKLLSFTLKDSWRN